MERYLWLQQAEQVLVRVRTQLWPFLFFQGHHGFHSRRTETRVLV